MQECLLVGYIAASIKNVSDLHVGDTITNFEKPADEPLPDFSFSFGFPSGAGMSFTILSSTSSTFNPDFADIHGASMLGIPIISSISAFTSSGLAFGRS